MHQVLTRCGLILFFKDFAHLDIGYLLAMAQFDNLVRQEAQAPLAVSLWGLLTGQKGDLVPQLGSGLHRAARTGRIIEAVQAFGGIPAGQFAQADGR